MYLYYWLVTRMMLAVAFVGYVRYCRKCRREGVPAYDVSIAMKRHPHDAILGAFVLAIWSIMPLVLEFCAPYSLLDYANYTLMVRTGIGLREHIALRLLGTSKKPKA